MKYHIIQVNDKTKTKVYLTREPITHDEACIMMPRLNIWPQFPYLRALVEEVTT